MDGLAYCEHSSNPRPGEVRCEVASCPHRERGAQEAAEVRVSVLLVAGGGHAQAGQGLP